jgi:O-methyltransferase
MIRFLKHNVKAAMLRRNSRFLRYWLPYHAFLVSPAELCLLCGCVEDTAATEGSIVEVGCEAGRTSVFLNKHMDAIGDKRQYFAIDTFRGFTEWDVAYETDRRGKDGEYLRGQFGSNAKVLFEKTMDINGIRRVTAIAGDIAELSIDFVGRVSFCFIDVDLYLPVKAALEKLLPKMSPGGIIAVHDCWVNGDSPFDGAYEAYKEFARANEFAEDVRHRLGFVRLPMHDAGAGK